MKPITSAANERYKAWLKLATQPRQVRLQRRTLAEGLHLAQAWLEAEWPVEAVLVRDDEAYGEAHGERNRLADALAQRAPAFALAPALFDALGLVEHGVGLALVVPVPDEAGGSVTGDALYLDGLQDPGNVGALLRVAAAAGVRHVFASGGTAALWAPKVLRAAQGAHLVLDLREGIAPEQLALMDVHWIGTALDGEPLWQAPLPTEPVGWLFGAEGQGLSAPARAMCRQRLRIPMAPGVESLNVATAAAVCLFERARRRAASR